MEKIVIDEDKGETVSDGFRKLIEKKADGKDAKWYFGGFVTTTDMIPDHYPIMSRVELENEMKHNAVSLKIDLIESKTGKGFFETEQIDEEYYAMYEEYEAEQIAKKTSINK